MQALESLENMGSFTKFASSELCVFRLVHGGWVGLHLRIHGSQTKMSGSNILHHIPLR